MKPSLFEGVVVVRLYRVKAPFVAVSPPSLNGSMQSIVLESGRIIKVESEHTTKRSGLVQIVSGDGHLLIYLRDLQDRTEPVAEAGAV